MIKRVIFFVILIFSIGCQEKRKPVISIKPNIQLPISCLKLNPLEGEEEFTSTLKKLYNFKSNCPNILTLSYKKNIVCNSGYNVAQKSFGKFPKSFLKLEVRKGLDVEYSYYIDLLDNVDIENIKDGFNRLKKDILSESTIEKPTKRQ